MKNVENLDTRYLQSKTTLISTLPYTNKYGDEYAISQHGVVYNITRSRVMKLKRDGDGYLLVHLGTGNQNLKVHRLVATAFIPNPDNKPTVDHINRDRTDNRFDNLRWATYLEQSNNTNSKGCPIMVVDLKNNKSIGFESIKEANDYYGLNNAYFSNLLSIGGLNKRFKVSYIN